MPLDTRFPVNQDILADEGTFSAIVRSAFSADGVVLSELEKQTGKPQRTRPEQIAYAEKVARAVARVEGGASAEAYKSVFLEASTGVGKTLGYLVPLMIQAALTDRQVVVATHTLALMRQISQKDATVAINAVERLCGVRPVVAHRRGMQNFPAPSRVEKLVDRIREQYVLNEAEDNELETFLAWCVRQDGVFQDWYDAYGDLPFGVTVDEVALHSNCPRSDFGAYTAECQAAKAAHLVVVSHALLVHHILHQNPILKGLDDVTPRAILVDEGDRLAESFDSVYDRSVPFHRVVSELNELTQRTDLTRYARTAAANAWEALSNLDDTLQALGEGMISEQLTMSDPRVGDSDHLQPYLASGWEAVEKLRGSLHKMKGDSTQIVGATTKGDIDDAEAVLREALAVLGTNDTTDDNCSIVASWSPEERRMRLRKVPFQPHLSTHRILRGRKQEDYADAARLLVITSASLLAPRNIDNDLRMDGNAGAWTFTRVAADLGISAKKGELHDDLCTVIEPKDFGRLSFAFAPEFPAPLIEVTSDDEDALEEETTVTDNPDWLQAAGKAIKSAANVPIMRDSERTPTSLVLVPSYATAENLAAELTAYPNLAPSVLLHERGEPLQDMIDTFRTEAAAGTGPIFITPAGWSGVDLPGLIDNLIIARLPFPSIDSVADTVYARFKRENERWSESKIDRILYLQRADRMGRTVRQGIGRAIRQQSDAARLWVLDPRFPIPGSIYKKFALPAKRDNPVFERALSGAIPERFTRRMNSRDKVWLVHETGEVSS